MWVNGLATQQMGSFTNEATEQETNRCSRGGANVYYSLCLAGVLSIASYGWGQQPSVVLQGQNSTASGRSSAARDRYDPPAAAHPEELKVTYSNELLSIVAHGCRFADVLKAIGHQTGVSVEFPGGSAEERIFFEIGPAPVRDVLQSLLDGGEFNYMILWSQEHPKQLARVVLSSRTRVASTAAEISSVSTPVSESSDEPAAYGVAFGGDPNEPVVAPATPEPDPGSFSASAEITKRAASENKTPGQVLDEMQKEFMQKLDAQATKSNQQ